ncbi:MAG: endonuclease VII domain-containing protein [Candidatus Peribacteraceae bacterium]|nr:endonuclease VII domain-containing protein [Candidatus Peribacteraceae bacterium]
MLYQRYNLTPEQYADILAAQKGICAICGGVNSDNKNLCVDHNHRTGKVRGLLCSMCNSMLGFATDNPDNLRKGIEYLNKEVDIE